MKKLYLVFLVLILLFIPTSINAVAVYQLDQPLFRLNGYTLREVFENRNMAMPDLTGKTDLGGGWYQIQLGAQYDRRYNVNTGEWFMNGVFPSLFTGSEIISFETNTLENYVLKPVLVSGTHNSTHGFIFRTSNNIYTPLNSGQTMIINNSITLQFRSNINGLVYNNAIIKFQLEKGSIATPYQVPTIGPYSDVDIDLFGLTNEEIQTYYDLYLEAVRFEQENIEASQDPGGYQNIFKSVINGVKGLIVEMGNVWQFLNAPIITSEMSDYSFSIDWSWDLIGVVRQLINSLAILILQTNFIFINLLFSFTGIPVQISILSMIFSNFIFVILGWIIVKSFII